MTYSQNSSTGVAVLLWPSPATNEVLKILFAVMFSEPLKQLSVFHHPSGRSDHEAAEVRMLILPHVDQGRLGMAEKLANR